MSAPRWIIAPAPIDAGTDYDHECAVCEGSGQIEHGESGSYYRDGEKYDAPGQHACEACGGTGRVLA